MKNREIIFISTYTTTLILVGAVFFENLADVKTSAQLKQTYITSSNQIPATPYTIIITPNVSADKVRENLQKSGVVPHPAKYWEGIE